MGRLYKRASSSHQDSTLMLDGGMTYREIAAVMHLSVEAIRKIEARALEKLKRFENRFKLVEIKETIAELEIPSLSRCFTNQNQI